MIPKSSSLSKYDSSYPLKISYAIKPFLKILFSIKCWAGEASRVINLRLWVTIDLSTTDTRRLVWRSRYAMARRRLEIIDGILDFVTRGLSMRFCEWILTIDDLVVYENSSVITLEPIYQSVTFYKMLIGKLVKSCCEVKNPPAKQLMTLVRKKQLLQSDKGKYWK